jgi:hypothetical protein
MRQDAHADNRAAEQGGEQRMNVRHGEHHRRHGRQTHDDQVDDDRLDHEALAHGRPGEQEEGDVDQHEQHAHRQRHDIGGQQRDAGNPAGDQSGRLQKDDAQHNE